MTFAASLLNGVDRLFAPLDLVRRAMYRSLVPWLGAWIRDRDVRIGIHGVSVVIGAFALALVAPLWLLALGPVILGVPHLLADVRYLVVRPGLHRRRAALPIGLLLALCTVLVDLRWGLLAVALAPLLATGSWRRKLLVTLPFLALFAAAMLSLRETQLALAHVHNLVAVALWVVLGTALHPPSVGGSRARWVTVIPFVVGGAAILMGAADGWIGPALGPTITEHMRSLAPGLDPTWAVRWVVLFAYAQAVHYGLWLRVMPEVGRTRPAPRSWSASLRALRNDFGDRTLALFVLLTVGVAVWGVFDLVAARTGYLRLALFHGPLELALLGVVAVEGRSVLRP